MNKFIQKITASSTIIGIIAKHEPLFILYALPQIVLNAALPLLYIYFPKLIIERLTSGKHYGDTAGIITVYACILLFINMMIVFLKNKSAMCSEMFSSKLKYEIGLNAMQLQLKDIESPETRDVIQMATKASEMTAAIGLFQNIISNIITVIGLSYIIVRLDWLFILLVAVTLSVKIIFVYTQYLYTKKLRQLEAENGRYANYLLNLSYHSEGGAKEMRLNSLQKWYMDKTKSYRAEMVDIHFQGIRNFAFKNITSAVITALQSFVILWVLSNRFIGGVISIADFTMYFSAVAALTSNLSAITEQLGKYSQQILNASDYQKLMKMTDIKIKDKDNKTPVPNQIEFVFENVSFSYPNSDKQILSNINIKIPDRQKLVIVGLNGAGKSTFIKLLCKFYRPTSGKITLNGVDIWDIPNEKYYAVIAAVFQDYANFSFSLKENISMCEDGDISRVFEILKSMGLNEQVNALPEGCNTFFTKKFNSNGIDFSGGQSQKIAIARVLYKNSPVLILDEPTASLDPEAESEIYENFFKMARDKTAIFISHRLAASTVADNIAVFSGGVIAEYGSHDELMIQNGLYAKMYIRQSGAYSV